MSEPRAELGRALSNYLSPEQVSKLIDEILAIEKRSSAEFTCKGCGKRQMQWTVISDAKAVTSALTDLMSQAFGRPQEANASQDPVQFYRLTRMEDMDALRNVEKDRGGHEGNGGEDGRLRARFDERAGLLEDQGGRPVQGVDNQVDAEETLRRCRACGELKPKIAFLPARRGAQVCGDCRK